MKKIYKYILAIVIALILFSGAIAFTHMSLSVRKTSDFKFISNPVLYSNALLILKSWDLK